MTAGAELGRCCQGGHFERAAVHELVELVRVERHVTREADGAHLVRVRVRVG
jgi:hypothetical protein